MTDGASAIADRPVDLGDGVLMPRIGFGVFQLSDESAERMSAVALDTGYRSIDTAAGYANEAGVGRAVAAAADRGIPRSDIFVTSKLANVDQQGFDRALRAFDRSVQILGGQPDLYLIHWPIPARGQYIDTWRAFVRLKQEGRLRAIGVSNFPPRLLHEIIDATGVPPALNQIELHPYLQQRETRLAHARLGIATEAWSPLGAGRGLLDDPVLGEVAARRGLTPAQITLAWSLARGNIVIPKSANAARVRENFAAGSVRLDAEDLTRIDGLDRGSRTGPDPEDFAD
jgi:diketogulonate reductase-like aldo/keto reductase